MVGKDGGQISWVLRDQGAGLNEHLSEGSVVRKKLELQPNKHSVSQEYTSQLFQKSLRRIS